MSAQSAQKTVFVTRIIPQNDDTPSLDSDAKWNIVKYYKKWSIGGFVETLQLVKINKLLSNAKISVACYRGKC